MFHSENNYCMESNYSSAICNYGLKLKSLCGLLMKLWPCLLLRESSNFRCRSRKHFSVAGSACALTFALPVLQEDLAGKRRARLELAKKSHFCLTSQHKCETQFQFSVPFACCCSASGIPSYPDARGQGRRRGLLH